MLSNMKICLVYSSACKCNARNFESADHLIYARRACNNNNSETIVNDTQLTSIISSH